MMNHRKPWQFHIKEWAEAGFLNIIGGCCGTPRPAHIKAIAEAVEGVKPRDPVEKQTLLSFKWSGASYDHT